MTRSTDLTIDEIVHLLGNARRRNVIQRMARVAQVDGVVGLGIKSLAKALTADENGCAIGELWSKDYNTVYISLYQDHIPALEDAGVVVNESIIKPGPNIDVLESALNSIVLGVEPYGVSVAKPGERNDGEERVRVDGRHGGGPA